MKTVYQVGFDGDRFRALEAQWDENVRLSGDVEHDPRLLAGVEIVEWPVRKRVPNVWMVIGSSCPVLDPIAFDALRDELAGLDLQPLQVGRRSLVAVEAPERRDAVDADRTQWRPGRRSGSAHRLEFHPDRLRGRSLFRQPGTNPGLYCWEDSETSQHGFRAAVEAASLKGLTFLEVWNSDTGGEYFHNPP
jgi:hypothetical protein